MFLTRPSVIPVFLVSATPLKLFLYPTQRVAEGIMFLTRPSVRQSCFSCQRNSSETAQENFLKRCNYKGHNV